MSLTTTASRARRRYEMAAGRVESGIQVLERRYTPLGRFSPGPFQGWSFLWQPAILGFVALCAILGASSFSNSPFKLNLAHTWFFGVPTELGLPPSPPNETTMLFSIVLGYGGLVLLMRVWLRLAEIVKHHPGSPVRSLWKIFVLWSIPMLVAPPLFSRDVFSYAAQGEMTSHKLSPYIFGPGTLGSTPFVTPVDHLWINTPAPYGPLFLFLDGSITRLSGHSPLGTVVGLRLLEFVAVALLAASLPMLARAIGRDPGEAVVLGVLNPLVLLTLIGGAHNDALMAALLVTGVGLAMKKHPLWGLFFCSCAAAIKAPAALGLVYIAWTWLGPNISWRRKIKPFAMAGLVAVVTLSVFTFLAGFGFGWVRNLDTPGTVRSWAAPATGLGVVVAQLAHAIGFHSVSEPFVITVTRAVGLLIAVAVAIWLLLNADRRGWVRSLAESLLVFVVLGPVVQPWYLVWGVVLLGVSYVGREHFWLLLLSITGPFMGLPGGRQLVHALVNANAFATIGALAILASMFLLPLGAWTQWSWRERVSAGGLVSELGTPHVGEN
jgi:alpha-1,6-mannosyltransferase